MRNLKLVFLVVFVLTLASGVVAGMLVSRLPTVGQTGAGTPRTMLDEELHLTPDQHSQMAMIWEGTRDVVDECFVKAQAYQKERDDELIGLLTDGQKAAYAKVNDRYVVQMNGLNEKRTANFKDAVQRTKELLSDTQRKRYEEILASRLGKGTPGGPPPPWMMPSPTPTTGPR